MDTAAKTPPVALVPRAPGLDKLAVLRLELPDRPGGLALVATALARHGVDILRVEIVEQDGALAVDDLLVRGGDLDAALASLEPEVQVVAREPRAELPDAGLAMAAACAAVTGARSLGEARRRLLESALPLVRADSAALLRDAGHGWLRPVASTVDSLPPIRPHEPALARAALRGLRALTASGGEEWAPPVYRSKLRAGAVVAVPAGAPPFLAVVVARAHPVPFAATEIARLEALVRVALGVLAVHGERAVSAPARPAVPLLVDGTSVSARLDVVDPGVVRIVLPGEACNAYLFVGERIALVDTGLRETTPVLLETLRQLGVPRQKVSLVVLTHEHPDHTGGADAFPGALVAAHPLAAAKLRHGDVSTSRAVETRTPDLELEHGSSIHLGGFSFRVMHTPGHSSGSICLYERSRALLVCGDTAFARGTLSLVTESGSRGDHLESLDRLASLQARLMLPGHGHVSDDPRGDLVAAAAAARAGAPVF